MELFDTVYNGKLVPFEFYRENVMVNATEMARLFDKQVVAFMRNDSTKSFISECLKSENSHFLNVESESDLINSRQRSGTWMHRVLALKFAAWLDPAFELWVFSTIDKILFDYYRRLEDSLKQSAKRKRDIEKIRQRLRKDEAYLKLEQLELEERQAVYARSKGNRQRLTVYQDAFEEEE